MNELTVFQNPTTAELREVFPHVKDSYLGHFYFLEYDAGLKIGCTNNPATRYAALSRSATKYGRVKLGALAVSPQHTNYRENEARLHQSFDSFRMPGTELFCISLPQAMSMLSAIPLEYRNDSEQIITGAEEFCEFAKEFTGLGKAVGELNISSQYRNADFQTFTNREIGVSVRTIKNEDGSISINAEDVAIGLGWSQTKNGVLYVKWERLNQHCASFGFSPKVGKNDFIPESLFYMLAMKANNDAALKFQKWLAFDVVPAIRKTGRFAMDGPVDRLTPDDYIRAASIVAKCNDRRLPVALKLLETAGISPEILKGFQKDRESPQKDKITADELAHLQTVLSCYTVRQAAELVNLSPGLISFYRRGLRLPSRERYGKMIEILE